MNDYQKLILDRVKERINDWLEALKQKSPELLLTRQWRIVWLKGFVQGQNTMPVITSCKDGEYQIAEIQVVLPPSLELDLEAVELVQKDEPYIAPSPTLSVASIDEPLDLLNDLVLGINGFLAGMPIQTMSNPEINVQSPISPLKVHSLNGYSNVLTDNHHGLEETIMKSPFLPDWFKQIENRNVAQGMLTKLTEGYAQYNQRKGYTAPLREYFEEYTDTLLVQDKLHYHCPYKGRGVDIDYQGYCQESFCSKKPHSSPCSVSNLRFGALDLS